MMDTVYFNCKCAPGNKDWLHCQVQAKRDGMLKVTVPCGYNTSTLEFPLTNVQRIEYGHDRSRSVF